jgi:hypothetical protein
MNRIYQCKVTAVEISGIGDSATPPVIGYFASVIRRSRWTR